MKILVVGGAGYIGSHCVRQLQANNHRPVILDNMSYGHVGAVPWGVKLYRGDMGDRELVRKILREEKIDVVMHFGGYIDVGESVVNPMKYFQNNVCASLRLFQVMLEEGVKKIIFSSTAAVYGEPKQLPLTEEMPLLPVNPYGHTKLDVEEILEALSKAHELSYVAFRYFNAAGVSKDGLVGEDHDPETHLIPLIIKTLLGQRKHIEIYGTDYDTQDGTCLRDYVHVDDLVRAHILALDKLDEKGGGYCYNLGTGKPYSVWEVIRAVESVTGKEVPVVEGNRRDGDSAVLYADATKAKKELGWELEYEEIEGIIETSWAWHQKNPEGYAD